MSERLSVTVDLDKLRARMQRELITEDDLDLLFAMIETLNMQAAKAETAQRAWTEIGAKAEADAAAIKEMLTLRQTCENCGGKGSYWTDVGGEAEHEVCDCYIATDDLLKQEHPGAALLTELEAARAVVAVLEANRIHGRCPLCGALSEHTAGCAIGRYNEAVKGRAE